MYVKASIAKRHNIFFYSVSLVDKQMNTSPNIHELTKMRYEFTALNEVDSCSLRVLANIVRKSDVHPKKPFHSLYIHFITDSKIT